MKLNIQTIDHKIEEGHLDCLRGLKNKSRGRPNKIRQD